MYKNNKIKIAIIGSGWFGCHIGLKLKEKNFNIINLDINFICEKPNISKYRKQMIKKISSILQIPEKIISIKATSNEKIGFIGDGLGIAAESIVQISNENIY